VIPRHFQIAIMALLVAIFLSGVFIIRWRHREQTFIQQETTTVPVATVVSGSQEKIQLLVAYDDDQALRWREAEVFMPADRGLRAREAMRALLAQYVQRPSPHPMARGADIRNVYFLDADTLVIDTTAPFADGHPSGILLEEMTLASLIETISANVEGINRVKFLVDGKERETLAGHADLMSFYQTAAVHELAQELQ
jgi:sporulation and spore germination protein